ncbi:hypothetical protein FCM35_KLT16969 [Carex littledalei]|uniref:Uncharacterized protein n=1 Tax=Carex littledalei TaxID=544730 RepID=A0A833RGR1_9POAL|nr:hypothetical protein FCM35_KLT16969 [Carex littledalei]
MSLVMSTDQLLFEAISRQEPCNKLKGVPPIPPSARHRDMARRRVPSNKELLRRALCPPVRRRGPPGLRRWTFRPMPSRLRNMSLD